MLGNFLTGEKATLNDRDLVLQRNGDNGMNRLSDQRGNKNYTETGIYSQDRLDISVLRNREKCTQECNINKTY